MTRCIYVVQMDIPPALEDEFNRIYDQEHIPNLLKVPGVHGCTRFKLRMGRPPDTAKYLAIYELDGPDVRMSSAWDAASDSGEWMTRIRPFTTNKSHLFFDQVSCFQGDAVARNK